MIADPQSHQREPPGAPGVLRVLPQAQQPRPAQEETLQAQLPQAQGHLQVHGHKHGRCRQHHQ